jgi:hypothetical protein
MSHLANIKPGARVMEPSAGTGRLLGALGGRMFGHNPDRGAAVAVEINQALADRLRSEFPLTRVHCADFLQWGAGEQFDAIVMNPPFINGADILHIKHAAGMLKPGGRLVALCANGPRQREQLRPLADYWEDLPAGTFSEAGTGVNVALLVIEAPAASGGDDDADQDQAPAVDTSGEENPGMASSEEKPAAPLAAYVAPVYPNDSQARELVRAVDKVDLIKRFSYLTPAGNNSLVGAAKNIRTELKRAWPGIKFSVTSERFSMGDAIRIKWTDGPTSKQVDDIANKYKAGSFDGMEDIYNYSSTGFNALFGDAKYISTSRENSDAAIAAALAVVARKWGAEALSLEDYKKGGAWRWQTEDGHRLDSEVHKALYAADYSLAPLAQAI